MQFWAWTLWVKALASAWLVEWWRRVRMQFWAWTLRAEALASARLVEWR
jgi:hypothetical protein